ncbi:DDE-type integrase/transposase/recombinase, partial [Streptomyces sulfonofaciens]|uniref:DDE-type integrase/transposase/recombinase n=1 Tax=Streptomyces sulfonofaciens TaxID=68272 RepID=UPI001674A291
MIHTGEGLLWLSAIRDAFSRRVVAWETSAHADADLVLTCLEYALASREVGPGQLIHHADQSCQYTSVKLTTRLVRAGIQTSMGSLGDSYDNALTETLWMLVKTQCVRGRTFTTRADVNLALFEYLDGIYNPRRFQKRPRLPQPRRVRGEALPQPGNGRTSEPDITSTCPEPPRLVWRLDFMKGSGHGTTLPLPA